MKKNSITNKITPCCNLPFSVMHWWLTNIQLNSETDREFLFSKLNQSGSLSKEAWIVLINSGILESDSSMTKMQFLDIINCKGQPNCNELKLLIEGLKIGNWTTETELPLNIATVDEIANGQTLIGNTYTKEQTDDKISDAKLSGIVGTATQTNAPTPYDAVTYPNGLFETYVVRTPLTMPNNWGSAVTQAELDANYVYFDVKNGVVSKEVSLKSNSLIFDESEKILTFADVNEAVYGSVNESGEFEILLSESAKSNANYTKMDDSNLIQKFTDKNGLIYGYVDLNGKFHIDIFEEPKTDKNLYFGNLELIKERLILNSVAVGRDRIPEVVLTDSGYTHPKVLFIKNGFSGFKYWMAITPTFGAIAVQTSPAFFENPTIFCSNDGENWIEPVGISNPIDVTAPSSFSDSVYPFWSDTHLVLGNDGYLYCYYRGVDMSKAYVNGNADLGNYAIVVVCKKSNNGVNWSDREIVYTSDSLGIDSLSQQLSPAFIKYENYIHCFDIIKPTIANPISEQKNQKTSFVIRRSSKNENGGFDDYSGNKIVNFINRPWAVNKAVWHLDAEYFNGVWYLLLNIGIENESFGRDLYLAYSVDGWNFTVFENPIYLGNSYRSSLTAISENENEINFNIYRADTTDGHISLIKLTLNKF